MFLQEVPVSLNQKRQALQNQGFLERTKSANGKFLSLTPLGLEILRKLEEDSQTEVE